MIGGTSFISLNSTHLCTPKMEDITTSKGVMLLGRRRRRSSSNSNRNRGVGVKVKAFFFNPSDERILKQALKEPVAFMGGMFAGLLRLDLSEDPLKEWVTRTVEASGITEVEIDAPDSETEETPQQIEIE